MSSRLCGWKLTETPCRLTAWETAVEPVGSGVYRSEAKITYQYESAGRTWTGTTYDAAAGNTPCWC